MRRQYLRASSPADARGFIADLEAQCFKDGDEAEVTFPDGSKMVFVLKARWEEKGTGKYIVFPNNK